MLDLNLLGAIDDYRNGRLSSARSKLINSDGTEARLCFLALHMRLRDAEQLVEAMTIANEMGESGQLEIEDEIQLRIYLSFILARTGDLDGAATTIREAMEMMRRLAVPPSTLDAEFTLANALILFMQGRVPASEREAWNAVYADLELGHRMEPLRVPLAPIQVTKARALTLIGVIRGTQEQFHEQYRFLREAMVMLRQSPTIDVYTTATLHANRSFYARDLGALSDIVELELSQHASWPPDLAEMRLEVSRSLSYLYALAGRDDLAMDGFAEAAGYAPTAANRLLLISDEAYVARQLPSSRILHAKLMEACAIADAIDWESIDAERYALHAFAQELAIVDPCRAQAYMSRYRGLRTGVNPIAITDKRAEAEARYSAGVVALANANRDYAIDSFASAFEIWRDIGFRWRATAAALELAEITSNAGMTGYVLRETPNYPNSWLARRASTLEQRAS